MGSMNVSVPDELLEKTDNQILQEKHGHSLSFAKRLGTQVEFARFHHVFAAC
jgi:hypothetical protein